MRRWSPNSGYGNSTKDPFTVQYERANKLQDKVDMLEDKVTDLLMAITLLEGEKAVLEGKLLLKEMT